MPVGHHVRVLRDLSALVRSEVTGKPLREELVEQARRAFDADAVALWRFESREQVWRIAAGTGLSDGYASVEIPALPDEETAALLAEPMLVDVTTSHTVRDHRRMLYQAEGIVAFLVLPLDIRGETAGTISCYYRAARAALTEEERHLAEAFAGVASAALSTERYDKLADVARDLAGRVDLGTLVQRITDAATHLTGAQFGAFFYNVTADDGESYMLYTIAGVPREHFEKFPMPRNTAVFAPTFAGTGIVRSANIQRDPRYGRNAPHHGMPAGHLPVVSYLAVPVKSRGVDVIGGLFFGHAEEGVFGETEEKIAEALAGHASVAIDNVRLYEALERDRAALRKEERRYRSLVTATPARQAIVVMNAAGEVIRASPSWQEITGQSGAEVVGRGWLETIHPVHRERVVPEWDDAVGNRRIFQDEYLLRQADGAYRWFANKTVPVLDDAGNVEEWIGAAVDIHDHHVAQEGLAFLARANEFFASSLDYRETLRNVTELAVPSVADWCAVDVAEAAEELRYARLAASPADSELAASAEELLRDIPRDLESGAMRSLGSISAMVVPLRSRGEMAGIITFVASERRYSQQDLARAEELAHRASIAIENARLYTAAQAANRAKDEFLATLSHEMRTPMTAVLGWARMLKLGLSESEAQTAIDAIEQSASAQAQLIEDVLDVSRIMSGKLTFEPRPTELRTVAEAAIATVRPAAAVKGIEILTSIAPALPPVSGDEGRLQQIIWNLLANAIKFTPRGGTVTLRIADAGPVVRLVVTDTGEGIDRAFLPYVFEPFRQADSSVTRTHSGLGLGLAIVRSLVELHGGRIEVASEGKGRGATFTLELPAMESAPAVASPVALAPVLPHASESLPALTGLSVLVVDDQEHTREIVAAILRRAGATVHTAASVRDALERFRTLQPHVVVCDIAMPQEDGYVFLREVRSRPDALRMTPILALTAFGRPEDRLRALSSGFDAYLKKPVDPAELAESVQRLSIRPSC